MQIKCNFTICNLIKNKYNSINYIYNSQWAYIKGKLKTFFPTNISMS